MPKLQDKAICNIELVEIITTGDSSKKYYFDTANEATYAPDISDGQENILRVKNRVVATNKYDDIQYGSTLTFKDTSFLPEVLCVVDGGSIVTGEENKVKSYSAPVTGKTVNRVRFTTNIYTAEKDVEGTILKYAKFSFPSCIGKPANFSFKDGEFMSPEYTILSRPKSGTAPYSIEFVDALPSDALPSMEE